MTFLRAARTKLSDDELARARAAFEQALAEGHARFLLDAPPGVLGYAVAHTIHGRTGLTHTTPMDHGEALHELRQCRQRGPGYTLVELREVSHGTQLHP